MIRPPLSAIVAHFCFTLQVSAPFGRNDAELLLRAVP
jgi:hypothetical protein